MILLLSDDPRDKMDEGTQDWLNHLSAAMPDETIYPMSADYDPADIDIAVMVRPPQGSLAHLTNLKWIHSLWAGVEHLLTDETIPSTCRSCD